MDRHTKLLTEFSRTKTQDEHFNKLGKSKKVLKHLKKTSDNI